MDRMHPGVSQRFVKIAPTIAKCNRQAQVIARNQYLFLANRVLSKPGVSHDRFGKSNYAGRQKYATVERLDGLRQEPYIS